MFSALPNDIARKISTMAIEERNEDVLDQIRNVAARVMDFAARGACDFVETPLFGGSKYLHITKFDKNELLKYRGMTTLTMTFWLHVEEFELTKHTYFTPDGTFGEENDYALFVADKQGKYGDVVAEVFRHIFQNAIVY
ncbi:hypothetical protein PBCVNEJV1_693L [Paramecium bursaria Chlorella virus NE-JV-1]|nr:hypothetical protein PBCVNEJV1_693L [Paramecium bursaria Chlorella virus NE-JV-1]